MQLWSVEGAPRLERSLSGLAPLPGLGEAIQSLAFSPDGGLLAGSDKGQTATIGHTLTSPLTTMAIWRAGTGALIAPPIELGAGNSLNGSDVLAFSPNGTLAAGTLGGWVEMWNPLTGKRVAPPLVADSSAITSLAFDPSGGRFAIAGQGDGTVKIWFTAGLAQEGPRLASDPGASSAAVFEPGGKVLLVVDDGGGAYAWPTSPAAWQERACALAGRNLTRTEWTQFVAGPPYTTVCP